MRKRIGGNIQQKNGGAFYPFDPRPEEVDIESIAHALSNLCRYTGHCSGFYSVAQHSVLVSREVRIDQALWGLLHDAPEAYINDISRPLKKDMHVYRGNETNNRSWSITRCEEKIMEAIAARYGLDLATYDHVEVKRADDVLLATEVRDFMGGNNEEIWGKWLSGIPTLPDKIVLWLPECLREYFPDKNFTDLKWAKDEFLKRLNELGGLCARG